jgi:AcrR family transcriptional regulator
MNAFTFLETAMTGLRQRQAQEREARILRAAESLFSRKKGYGRTSMQEIAKRSKLAVGTLYNYFPSKPKILLAIIARDASDGLSAGEKVLKRPPRDPVRAVEMLIDQAIAPYVTHGRELWRQLVAAAMTDPELAEGVFRADASLIGLLSALLGELEARGDLRDGVEPGHAAIALYSAFFTWFFAYLANDSVELDDLREQLSGSIQLIMHGLLAPDSGEPS